MSFPRYPKHRASGVEWLGDVPEHWEPRRLKHNLRLATEKTERHDRAVALTDAEDRIRFAREKRLLDEMTEIAEAARGLPDTRVRRLIQWIRENMCPDLREPGRPRPSAPAEWNDIRRDRIDALEQDIQSADLAPEKRATVADELEAARERDEQLRKQIDHPPHAWRTRRKVSAWTRPISARRSLVPWDCWGRSR